MASIIDIKWHSNNQNGIDIALLYDGYILPKIKNKSIWFNQLQMQTPKWKLPCPASLTISNEEVVRGVFDHNHKPLSNVECAAIETTRRIKELAATSRKPLQQIYSEEQGKLVQKLN
jgi:hypothetical protein